MPEQTLIIGCHPGKTVLDVDPDTIRSESCGCTVGNTYRVRRYPSLFEEMGGWPRTLERCPGHLWMSFTHYERWTILFTTPWLASDASTVPFDFTVDEWVQMTERIYEAAQGWVPDTVNARLS